MTPFLRGCAAPFLFCLTLWACVSFQPPMWTDKFNDPAGQSRYLSLNSVDDVQYYLRLHTRTYDRMISDAEAGRVLLEFPVVAAAIAGPAGLALGESDKFAIRVATAAVAGTAGSTWIQPRQRILQAVQARSAITCVSREYVNQQANKEALRGLRAAHAFKLRQASLDKVDAAEQNALARGAAAWDTALDMLSSEIQDDGRVAVDAADEIVSRLKVRLANVGAAPDYSAQLAIIRAQFESARTKTESITGGGDEQKLLGEADEDAVERVAEFPARVAECVAKVP